MNMDNIIQPIYLVSAALFILSLMWMGHPSTARRGVRSPASSPWSPPSAARCCCRRFKAYHWIGIAVVAGFILGIPLALVPLTAVPQRTALSHAFGGLAAGLVGAAEYYLWIS